MGCLSPALADLMPHLPDLLGQSYGVLDLQEAHQGLQPRHVRSSWHFRKLAFSHLHPVVLEGNHGYFEDVSV